MARKNQNRRQKKVKNTPADNSMPPKEQSNNTGSEIKETKPHKDKESIPPTDKQNLINDKTKDENNRAIAAAERANQLAKVGHTINAIMVFATIALFIITLKTLEQTKRSVDIANESLKDNRENNTANDKRAKEAFDLAKADYENRQIDYEKRQIKDSLNIKLLEQSVIAQNQATGASKTQFNISNEPYLQADNPEITISDNEVTINFSLNNYGNYPVRVTGMRTGVVTKVVPPPITEIYNKGEIKEPTSMYIVKGNPVNASPNKKMPITRSNIEHILAKRRKLYIWVYTEYKNLITGKFKTYTFMVGINPFEETIGQFLYNENR